MECHGVPEYVIVNGRVIVDDGHLKAVEGHGRFIETPVYAPYVYNMENTESVKPIRVEHVSNNEEISTPKKVIQQKNAYVIFAIFQFILASTFGKYLSHTYTARISYINTILQRSKTRRSKKYSGFNILHQW